MTTPAGPKAPRSGSSALAAGALVQAVLGVEFVLAGLNKLADPRYVAHFRDFATSSVSVAGEPLASLVRWLVLPNIALMAQLTRFTELTAGLVLVVAAAEVARRRFSGPLAARHGYEPATAMAAAMAALALGGLSLTIYLLQGGVLPRINGGLAFGPPISIELFNVPLALAVAWIELARYRALRTEPSAGGRPHREELKGPRAGGRPLSGAPGGQSA